MDLLTDTRFDRWVRDPRRLDAGRRAALLDGPPDERLVRLARLAARQLGVPAALIAIAGDRELPHLLCGVAPPPADPDALARGCAALFRGVITERAPLVVPDAAEHPLGRDDAALRAAGVRAWLGLPLGVDDAPIGALCALDFAPRGFGEGDVELLGALADAASARIAERLREAGEARSPRDGRAFLQAIEAATLAGIAAVDREGRQTYVNPAFAKLVGWPAEELIGARPPFVYWPPDELPAIERAFALTLRGEAPPGGFELPFLRRSGEKFWAQLLIAPLPGDGPEPAGWLASIYDVSERRRAEAQREELVREQVARAEAEAAAARYSFLARAGERFANSLDYDRTVSSIAALAVPYFADWCLVDLVGPDREIQRVSVAAESAEKRALLEALRREYPPTWSSPQPASQALRENRPVLFPAFTAERLAAVCRDDRHYELMVRLAPASAIAVPMALRGEVIGAITFAVAESGRRYEERDLGLAEDFARRAALALENARLYAEAQEQRERAEVARAEAEAASRVKDEFLAMLGHELRNPLAPMRTALELMRLKHRAHPGREVEVLHRQVQHLVRLVDDLLDLARLTRGQLELRRERVEIATVIARAIEMASPLFEQREHTLAVDVPATGLAVDADPARLAQVIANLLVNAAKYTPPRGSVRVSAERVEARVRVRVADSGSGIAPEMLPRIFDMFVQGRQTLARSDGGLGIGLTLVKSLVRMHDGTVSAHSDGLGCGSTFTVELPAADLAPAPARRPAPDVAAGPARRILLVDDNVDAANVLAELLRTLGHELAVAYDGPSALDLAERFRPEVVLLDIGLPVMDGYEVARRLRQDHGDRLWITALTGYGQEHDRERSAAAGMNAHFVKPLDLDALLAAMRALPVRG